ncbi:phosphoenolpyruvate-utilizing N-terminal domain-containing protein, partial [Georgenia sp. 10Sc9-8]|nr:phosphoenolpyruvate-utilizing N-terminal domain-containing protein [Georgenia halotolerans]
MSTDEATSEDRAVLRGLGVSPGRAAGRVARMADPIAAPARETLGAGADVESEADRVAAAAQRVAAELTAAAEGAGDEGREVLETTAQMATDPTLVKTA